MKVKYIETCVIQFWLSLLKMGCSCDLDEILHWMKWVFFCVCFVFVFFSHLCIPLYVKSFFVFAQHGKVCDMSWGIIRVPRWQHLLPAGFGRLGMLPQDQCKCARHSVNLHWVKGRGFMIILNFVASVWYLIAKDGAAMWNSFKWFNNKVRSCQPLLGVNISPEFVNLYYPYAGWGLLFFCW